MPVATALEMVYDGSGFLILALSLMTSLDLHCIGCSDCLELVHIWLHVSIYSELNCGWALLFWYIHNTPIISTGSGSGRRSGGCLTFEAL
jgi:hypothetical protein